MSSLNASDLLLLCATPKIGLPYTKCLLDFKAIYLLPLVFPPFPLIKWLFEMKWCLGGSTLVK